MSTKKGRFTALLIAVIIYLLWLGLHRKQAIFLMITSVIATEIGITTYADR